jgi:hypothetical protein
MVGAGRPPLKRRAGLEVVHGDIPSPEGRDNAPQLRGNGVPHAGEPHLRVPRGNGKGEVQYTHIG